ncbi:MAG: ABC transporter permease [Deltaproteobacteria bacterium]|nr:ABC transporter permease [Deltaproteobacteria bacterium]
MSEEEVPTTGGLLGALKRALQPLHDGIEEFGTIARLGISAFMWQFRRPYRFGVLVQQLEFVGVQSMFLVCLVGLFTGMVFAVQTAYGFRRFGAENLVGGVVALSLSREMAPVLTAIMVAARAGSGMAAQLGNMRATEQIDALETMAVSPIQYLVVPRLIAGTLMVPVLALLFFGVGLGGAYLVGVGLLSLDQGIFLDRITALLDKRDLVQGLVKATIFGYSVTLISCRHGYYAKGGAEGVGLATTRAVVWSVVGVFFLDYLITSVLTEMS